MAAIVTNNVLQTDDNTLYALTGALVEPDPSDEMFAFIDKQRVSLGASYATVLPALSAAVGRSDSGGSGGGSSGPATAATAGSTGAIALSGDLAGSATSPVVAKINGVTVAGTPTAGQIIAATSATAASWTSLPSAPAAMTGATVTTAGTGGTVPLPPAGPVSDVLRRDATWGPVPSATVMTGATATVAGTGGTVPAPPAGTVTDVFRRDGSWGPAPSATVATTTATGTVTLADTAAVTAGTAARIVDAAQMLAADTAVRTAVSTILGVTLADADLGTFTGTIIADDVTVKVALQTLETRLENQNITGRFIGSAATFATLPTTSAATGAAVNGDWASLTTDTVGTGTVPAPQYPAGVYLYNGTAYSFAFALNASAGAGTLAEVNAGTVTAVRAWTPAVLQTAVAGRYRGAANTFAGLPATTTNGDWAALTDDVIGTGTAIAPQYPRGIYLSNGTVYALSVPLPLGAAAGTAGTLAEVEAGTVTAVRTWNPDVLNDAVAGRYRGTAATFATLPASTTPRDWAYLSADTVGTGTVSAPQYPRGIYSTNGTAYSLVYAVTSAGASTIPVWAASTAVVADEIRRVLVGGAIVVLRSTSSRTTGAAADAAEFGNWSYVGQSTIPVFEAGAVYPTGFQLRVIVNGVAGQYERITSGTDGGSFVPANWVSVSAPGMVGASTTVAGAAGAVPAPAINENGLFLRGDATWSAAGAAIAWAASTRVQAGELRNISIGTVRVIIRSTSARTTGAAFDTAEAGQWEYVGQSNVIGFTASAVYPAGYRIYHGGFERVRLTAGTAAATIDAHEWSSLIETENVAYANSTKVVTGERRTATIGGAVCLLTSTAQRTTGTTGLDLAELGNWTLLRQNLTPTYTSDTIYPNNFQITNAGCIWEKDGTGSGGSTFNTTNWRRLTDQATGKLPAARLVAGAKGTTITYGTIQAGCTASGNATMAVRASTSTGITVAHTTWLTWSDGADVASVALNGSAGTTTVLNGSWNLTAVGQRQWATIYDQTNARTYEIVMITQGSHNNNVFHCREI